MIPTAIAVPPGITLRLCRRFSRTPAVVFRAWTNPDNVNPRTRAQSVSQSTKKALAKTSSNFHQRSDSGEVDHDLTIRAMAAVASAIFSSASWPPAATALTTQCDRWSSSSSSATAWSARVVAET